MSSYFLTGITCSIVLFLPTSLVDDNCMNDMQVENLCISKLKIGLPISIRYSGASLGEIDNLFLEGFRKTSLGEYTYVLLYIYFQFSTFTFCITPPKSRF